MPVTLVTQTGAHQRLVPSTLAAAFWLGAGLSCVAFSLMDLAGYLPKRTSPTPLKRLFSAANPTPRLRLTLPRPIGLLIVALALAGPPLVRLSGVQRLYSLDAPLLLFFFIFSVMEFLNGPGWLHRGRLNLCLLRWTGWLGSILIAPASIFGVLACLGLIHPGSR